MIQEGVTRDLSCIDESEEKEETVRTSPPNRKRFQKDVQAVNGQINGLRRQIHELVDHDGMTGTISMTRQKKERKRSEREEKYAQMSAIKKKTEEVKEKAVKLKAEKITLEKSCRVRSIEKIDEYIRQHEERYKKSSNAREEQLIVNEIDNLKRNRVKLEKLQDVLRVKSEIDGRLNELKKEQEAIFKSLYQLKEEYTRAGKDLRTLLDSLKSIRVSMDELYQSKRALVQTYERDRHRYSEYIREKRSHESLYPATFPGRTRNQSLCTDEEELEPFYEQKRDCRRLIQYLEKLHTQVEKSSDGTTSESMEASCGSASDSADEFPAGFERLHLHEPQRTVSLSAKKKPVHVRKIKLTQPISHGVEVYKLFGSVDVRVPVSYQDLPRALDEVKEQLHFFEHQTSVIDWTEELKHYDIPFSMSRTVSEFTGDSCIDSETNSLTSFRLRSSDESPLPRISSTTDEGMSSKESHSEVPLYDTLVSRSIDTQPPPTEDSTLH